MKTFLTILITAIVVFGGSVGAWWYLKKRAAGEEPAAVRIEPAVRSELVEVVSAPGQIQPRNKVSISARVAARIVELPYIEGQDVTAGHEGWWKIPPSVLVKLDSKEYEAALRSAEARKASEASQLVVARARASAQQAQKEAVEVSLKDAQRDLERQLALRKTGDVSQAILDAAQTKCENLKAQIRAAAQAYEAENANLQVLKHNLDAAEADIQRQRDALTYCTITSPLDGVVTRLNTKVGELVVMGTMNNPGTVIMEVADFNTMLAVAKLDETTIAGVEVGQKAKVYIQAYPDEIFEGIVDTVALAHTEERDGTKYYKTEILLNTKGRRIPCGLSADVDIEIKRHQDVVKVPSQSVLGRTVDELPPDIRALPEVEKNKTTTVVVYRAIGGKAVVTPVKIGPSDVTHTIIKSGLSADDHVIVGPYKVLETLKHGQNVKESDVTAPKPGEKK